MLKKLEQEFTIIKDLGSIRAKSVMLEDIDKYLGSNFVCIKEESNQVTSTLVWYLATETVTIFELHGGMAGKQFALYSYYANAGIPTLKFACNDIAVWTWVKECLRASDLVR